MQHRKSSFGFNTSQRRNDLTCNNKFVISNRQNDLRFNYTRQLNDGAHNMNIGEHITTPRIGYTHHGLTIGNGSVIHYSGFADGLTSGKISIVSLAEFANGNKVEIERHSNRKYTRQQSVDRALQRLGEDDYSLIFNNCEHFVNWCITGVHARHQVNNAAIKTTETVATYTALRNQESVS